MSTKKPSSKPNAPAAADASVGDTPPAADASADEATAGEVVVLAERERDGFLHRVVTDSKRVWKEIVELEEKL